MNSCEEVHFQNKSAFCVEDSWYKPCYRLMILVKFNNNDN